MNKILFINGSPNKNGNTARLAHLFLKGHDYDTLNLVDLKIYSYGQHFADDQYQEVIRAISSHEVIVNGMSAMLFLAASNSSNSRYSLSAFKSLPSASSVKYSGVNGE